MTLYYTTIQVSTAKCHSLTFPLKEEDCARARFTERHPFPVGQLPQPGEVPARVRASLLFESLMFPTA